MFLFKDMPAAPSSASVTPVSRMIIPTLCATLICNVGLGQHLCGLLRSDSMITTCMFSTLKVAVNSAFCPLPAISLATGGSCFIEGECLPTYFPPWFL